MENKFLENKKQSQKELKSKFIKFLKDNNFKNYNKLLSIKTGFSFNVMKPYISINCNSFNGLAIFSNEDMIKFLELESIKDYIIESQKMDLDEKINKLPTKQETQKGRVKL